MRHTEPQANAADIDDDAAFLFNHMRDDRFRAPECAIKISVENAPKLIEIQLLDRRSRVYSGVVYKDIDAAEFLHHRFYGALSLVAFGDIELDLKSWLHRPGGFGEITDSGGHFGPAPQKPVYQTEPHSFTTPRYKAHFICQLNRYGCKRVARAISLQLKSSPGEVSRSSLCAEGRQNFSMKPIASWVPSSWLTVSASPGIPGRKSS
jgi:hypothetical protein